MLRKRLALVLSAVLVTAYVAPTAMAAAESASKSAPTAMRACQPKTPAQSHQALVSALEQWQMAGGVLTAAGENVVNGGMPSSTAGPSTSSLDFSVLATNGPAGPLSLSASPFSLPGGGGSGGYLFTTVFLCVLNQAAYLLFTATPGTYSGLIDTRNPITLKTNENSGGITSCSPINSPCLILSVGTAVAGWEVDAIKIYGTNLAAPTSSWCAYL